jgi:hypothetical protein
MQLYSSTQIFSIIMELKFPKVRVLVSVFNSIENMSFFFLQRRPTKNTNYLQLECNPTIIIFKFE